MGSDALPAAENQRKQNEVLAEMERALLAELDSTKFLQLLVESASRRFDALTGVWLVVGDDLLVERITSVPGTFPEGRMAFGEGMSGRCAATRNGLLVPDYPHWEHAVPRYVAAGLRCAMAQPLIMGDHLLGVLTMSRTGDDASPFTESDLASLERLAGLAALALRNSMLYEEAVRRRRQVEVLAEAEREMVGELGRERLLRLIVQRAAGLFDAGAIVYLLRGTDLVPAAQVVTSHVLSRSIPLDTGVCGRSATSRRGMLANHYSRQSEAVTEVVAGGLTHLIVQPLLVHDELHGVIAVGRTGADALPFTEDDLDALGHFARLAAIAVVNATLYEQAERRREEAEVLAGVARALTGMRDVEQIADRLVASNQELLGSHRAAVGMLQADGGLAMLAAESHSLVRGQVVQPDIGLVAQAMREGRVVATTDILNDPRLTVSEQRRKILIAEGIRAAAAVPLRARDRTIGAVMLGFPDCRALSEDELRLAQALADGAALALENARLYQEAERRRREAEVAAAIARTIIASLDLDEILQQVAEGARALCQSDIARIALRDPQSGAVVFRYWVNTRYEGYETVELRPGQSGLGGLTLLTGQPHRTDDWMVDRRFSKETASVVQAEGIISMMVVPIKIGDDVEGLLYVDNRTPRSFTDLEESALVQLAGHAALAIKNARLFAAVQAAGHRLQAVSSRLLEVQEAERRHLARELHDEIGQALTAVKINLQMLRRLPNMGAAAGRLDDSLSMLNRILEGVRQVSLDLRPSLLDDLGLAAALRWYVEAQAQRAGLTPEVVTGTLPDELPTATATTCFRFVQEAVTNVLRHARATRVRVTLQCVDAGLTVSITDDGIGFDVTAARRRALAGESLGILGLEERVHLAGGHSSIESSPGGHCTTVRAWLPLAVPSSGLPAGANGATR